MFLQKEYIYNIAKILLISFIMQLCMTTMSYASIDTSVLMPQRTIVTASGAANPATPATTSASETLINPATASTLETHASPATASTPETHVSPATSSTSETPVNPSMPAGPATPATASAISTASESVSEKESVKAVTSEQSKSDDSESKSKTTSGNIKSSGSYSSGGSSGNYSCSSPYYGDVVQIISAPPIQSGSFANVTSGQNKTPTVTSTAKTQNTIKKSAEKGEEETDAIKTTEKDTTNESSVKIISSKHEATRGTAINDLSGTEPENMEELPESKENTNGSFSSISKKIIIIVGAVLVITALAGGGIYYFSKKH